ncbi:MAG TPA: GIY-YIG nuclease family protein [Candidatus Saccharimonadales bacterium]|nr:GIY-YIG nuclease family protein [Candidatus Saccharimonadales bacterium]
MKQYYVYIATNRSKTLYVGMSNDLERRMRGHKSKLIPGFTARYNIDRLVYFESTSDVIAAIAREKELKGWLRRRKIALTIGDEPGVERFVARFFAGLRMTKERLEVFCVLEVASFNF